MSAEEDLAGAIAPLNIPFLECKAHHCREVVGQGDDGLATFCGHPRSGATSYCAYHRRINHTMVLDVLPIEQKVAAE
jgi:hypothetical protein